MRGFLFQMDLGGFGKIMRKITILFVNMVDEL